MFLSYGLGLPVVMLQSDRESHIDSCLSKPILETDSLHDKTTLHNLSWAPLAHLWSGTCCFPLRCPRTDGGYRSLVPEYQPQKEDQLLQRARGATPCHLWDRPLPWHQPEREPVPENRATWISYPGKQLRTHVSMPERVRTDSRTRECNGVGLYYKCPVFKMGPACVLLTLVTGFLFIF